MTQLVINIDNDSIIPSLKKILKSLSGVVSVKTERTNDDSLIDPETGHRLNDKTMKVIREVESHRAKIKSFDSTESLINDLLS